MISDSKKEIRFKNLRFVSSAIVHQKNIETGVFSTKGNLAFLRRVHKQPQGFDVMTAVVRTGPEHLTTTKRNSPDTATAITSGRHPEMSKLLLFSRFST
ncbi:hypothetical protein [Labrenzia sp. OB1]|uniref:hypothetical protein n=1 Tax=Labrenzia sp. OB1 TaxID=1561204 RepID=UPI0012E77529|nr:hypothetical protein [Labrenzia sp. OB1]